MNLGLVEIGNGRPTYYVVDRDVRDRAPAYVDFSYEGEVCLAFLECDVVDNPDRVRRAADLLGVSFFTAELFGDGGAVCERPALSAMISGGRVESGLYRGLGVDRFIFEAVRSVHETCPV